jgi:23S rRNA (cytidine1920-2'-O)/16S rRNA (cytidine1409-2'-O)-methyltransferase
MGRSRRTTLARALAARHPGIADPMGAIASGRVRVGGRVVTNPDSLVAGTESIVVVSQEPLRGETKLAVALERFRPRVRDVVALDVGAAAGGFTKALLDRGVRRVYAVDVGSGQLRGSIRQDARVVVLERTNLARLDTRLVPDAVELVTLDLSYLSIARALPQLDARLLADGCALIALVKPMFELGRGSLPDEQGVNDALARACAAAENEGWSVQDTMRSPVLGGRGAVELFLYVLRRGS